MVGAGDWREVAIGDIADIVGGATPSTQDPDNFGGGIPWLTPKDLSGPHDRYIAQGARNLSQQGLDSCSAKLLPAGAVLLSTRAPVGYVAIAKNPIATNQGFRSLIVREGVSAEYLYYWLSTHTEELERHASGSTFRELSGSALKSIKLRLPPLGEQRRIAGVLGALDDKIELNRRMARTLEQIARALFRSWFVDFEPVRAKQAQRWSPGQSLPGLPAQLRQLFPDQLEPSPQGPIPQGWQVATLGDCFDLTMGQSPPGRTYNEQGEGLPFFQGRADFGARYPTNRKFCSAPTRLAQASDTLVSVRAPVGDINMAWEECCIGRGVAALRHRSGSTAYTYYAVQALQPALRAYESEGTVFGAINKGQFESLQVVEPPVELIDAFDLEASRMDARIRIAEGETARLTEARDALLPRMLSGMLK